MTTPSAPLGALPLAFTKMSGAGNDFLVFGERAPRGAVTSAVVSSVLNPSEWEKEPRPGLC